MILAISDTLKTLPPAVVIPLAADDTLNEALARVAEDTRIKASVLSEDFKAEAGEVQPVYKENTRFYLLGLGAQAGFAETLRAFRSFSHKYRQKLPRQVALDFTYAPNGPDTALYAEAAVNGLRLGTYQIGKFRKASDTNAHPLSHQDARVELIVEKPHTKTCAKAAQRGSEIADTQMRIFDLVNAPSNKKTALDLARWALKSGEQFGFRVRVMDRQEIEATGLHALMAVNRGSEYPPAFIIMEYQPRRKPKSGLKKVGLVGKGVTFDTGGLSIKPSSNMHYMKSDMGGAAAVFGTMEAAARLQLPIHLIGIVPATDNSVDAKAIKPSDVIDSYSGKTIEVIDTDAEGRLILADGLNYMARNFQPEVMVNLATLTGSAVRTFGYHAAALFSNDDQLASQLTLAGEKSGERLWRLPIWDVYKEDIKSDVADLRNFSGRPLAGAIGAAKFLEAFIDGHPRWAHMDIAGVAFNDSEFAIQKSATGFGIRLLLEYIGEIIEGLMD